MRLLPKSEDFFQYFDAAARCIVEGAGLLNEIVARPDRAADLARQIRDLEHKADETTHETIRKLHTTFITPFDREDIHSLISRLDDIMDAIHMAASRIVLFEIRVLPDDLEALTALLQKAAQTMSGALGKFKDLKHADETMKEVIEINRIENEGDVAFRAGLANLFKDVKDPIEVVKLKDVYEVVETAIDRCEDVANVIEGVLVKFA